MTPARQPFPAPAEVLDEHLFLPSGVFLLDAENRRVRAVASLEAARAAVAAGEAASYAACLRPEAVVVDVDVEDGPRASGSAIAEELVAWCVGRGVWHLVRPSGGAEGRHHVLVVPGEHREDLAALVAALRARHRVRGAAIDLRAGRAAVRPLSAPHRRGGRPAPLGDLRKALAGLLEVLPAAPVGLRVPEKARSRVGAVLASGSVPLASVRVCRREVVQGWADYLEQGTPPVPDGDRSGIELMATTAMVRAGLEVEQAWELVQGAHPGAMGKARARGRDWWVRHVWNTAVATDNAFLDEHSAYDPMPTTRRPASEDLSDDPGAWEARAAVEAARAAVRVLQWQVPHRARPGWLHVVHTVLDRMARTGQTVVPCPERDLFVDTGLDRGTVRAHLHAAAAAGLWEVVAAFDPTHRATSSHLVSLDPRYAQERGLSQIPPPVVHTPLPTRWHSTLPSPAVALLRCLPHAGTGASTTQAARSAGLSAGPSAELSPRQARTAKEALHTLAAVGLAEQDTDGLWRRVDRPSPVLRASAAAARAERLEQVELERIAYRQGGAHGRWARARAAALRRDATAARAHFDALTPEEQAARRERARTAFFALSPAGQLHEKARYAARRAAAGGTDERTHHQAWAAGLSPGQWERRSTAGQIWYASLDPHLRRAYAGAWDEHRRRHGLTAPGRGVRERAA